MVYTSSAGYWLAIRTRRSANRRRRHPIATRTGHRGASARMIVCWCGVLESKIHLSVRLSGKWRLR